MNDPVDYSFVYMRALKTLKEVHLAMLTRQYDTAIEKTELASADMKLVLNAIKSEKESRTRDK